MDLQEYLAPSEFLDFDSPAVQHWLAEHPGPSGAEGAIALYYRVRDGWRYDPYRVSTEREKSRASYVITRTSGYCTSKAVLLAALCRAIGVPARIGFGDVRNHLASPRLVAWLQSELFAWHGFTELYIGGRWVRCTPAFDAKLCERFGVPPLEFDGEHDSLFHAFDPAGRKFMEYVIYRGVYADLPYEEMFASLAEIYPHLFKKDSAQLSGSV